MVSPQEDLDAIVEEVTEVTVEEGGAQVGGVTQESTAPSPRREEEQPMEVHLPASPVSRREDDLLTGVAATIAATATGVESELASLQVTSSPEGDRDHQEASS